MKGFRAFLTRGNLIDLAVAVVIGVAFNNVVQALIKDIITPIIGALGGQPDFSSLSFTVNHSHFLYGSFLNALISFVIIAAVIYFIVVAPMNRVMSLRATSLEATTRTCPECASEIPLAARRCMYCTSEVPPATTAVAS